MSIDLEVITPVMQVRVQEYRGRQWVEVLSTAPITSIFELRTFSFVFRKVKIRNSLDDTTVAYVYALSINGFKIDW
jgi:hypothetical protein